MHITASTRKFKIKGPCKWRVSYSKDRIIIGCTEKSTREWEEWFAGNEEFETKRGTLDFEEIHKAFLEAKACQEVGNSNN